MKLERIPNRLGEELWRGRAGTGLSVIVAPRPGNERTLAALGTNFGSVDRVSGPDHEPVPEGLAHFLEHKLFEDERGDVSDRFSALGASSNAMTGFCGTTYVVSTVDEVLPCLDLLLDFVQQPYFTPELVAKEQGIIAQEIRMYDDDPDWRAFFGLLGCLYERHPVRDNIAGTVESIARIDVAHLRRCYDLFYRPANMCLSVCGPVDPQAVAELVERDQAERPADALGPHERLSVAEPVGRVKERIEVQLPVARPRLLLGIKEAALGGDARAVARRQLATRILLDILFGRASPAFEHLYGEGLVDETFSASFSGEEGFGFTTVGGDCDDPELLLERLHDVFRLARREGLDGDAHRRVRNRLYGMTLRALDSVDTVAMSLLAEHLRGATPFLALDLVEEITVAELEARLTEHVREDAMAACIVRPSSS